MFVASVAKRSKRPGKDGSEAGVKRLEKVAEEIAVLDRQIQFWGMPKKEKKKKSRISRCST